MSHSDEHRFKFRRIVFVSALALLMLVASGCGMSRLAANQIITAPNHQHPTYPDDYYARWWTNFLAGKSSNSLRSMTIPVGPPAAKLKAVALLPGDYGWKFVTKMATNKNVKSLYLNAERDTNHTFTPLPQPATIVLLHGYTLTKESMLPWAFVFAQAGYRVVMIDLRGHGQSTGQWIGFGKYETEDLKQALDYLIAQQLCDERVGVLGLSYGATMALHWAAHDPRVRAVATIAPYNHPDDAIVRFVAMTRIPVPQKSVRAAAATVATKLDLKWNEWSAETAMRKIQCPVFLISGEKDPICQRDDIEALKRAATCSTKSLEIAGADHIVLGALFHELTEPLKNWFGEHLRVTN